MTDEASCYLFCYTSWLTVPACFLVFFDRKPWRHVVWRLKGLSIIGLAWVNEILFATCVLDCD